MLKLRHCVYALPACVIGGSAYAALTASWVPVTITATTDGVTPPPGLAGYQSFDLVANLDPGDDFQSMRIKADGTFFQHSLGSSATPPNSGLFGTFPALQFDSYFDDNGNFQILGSTDGTNDLPPPGVFDNAHLAVAGGDLVTNTSGGPLKLLRLTFTGTTPTFLGSIFSAQNSNGIPVPQIGVVPEPASLGLLAAVGLAAWRRRTA
jgi:hypothetical protein